MCKISDDDIAIIGYAFELPQGIDSDNKFWEILEGGKDVIEEIPKDRWDWKKIYHQDTDAVGKAYAHHGSFLHDIDKFDPNAFRITPVESDNIDPQQRLVLKTAWRAMENSFLQIDKLKHSNTGVFIGATMDDYLQLQTRLHKGKHINRYTHFGAVLNNIAGRVSFVFGFHGPSMTIDTACSSSLVALDSAIKSVRDGDCDIALAGGVNVILTEELYIKFSRAQMLSRTGKCKTFDNSADGYVRGEGCGILIIQKVGRAKVEGKRILAVIRGSSVNHNGNSSGLTVPSGKAQEDLVTSCIKKANINIDELDYIEAHGTGTQLGDKIEVKALQKVFAERKRPLFIGSVKTNLGHLESAAGVAGVIKVLLSMQKNIIPRSINIKEKNKNIDWENSTIKVAEENIKWNTQVKLAGISSFGASGTNVHVILQKYDEGRSIEEAEINSKLGLAISAKNLDSLLTLATNMMNFINEKDEDSVRTICRVNNISRSQYSYRIAVYADSKQELLIRLNEAIKSYSEESSKEDVSRELIYSCNNGSNSGNYIKLYKTSKQYRKLVVKLCECMAESEQISELSKECEKLTSFILEAAFFQYIASIGFKKYKISGSEFVNFELLFAEGRLTSEELSQIAEVLRDEGDTSTFAALANGSISQYYYYQEPSSISRGVKIDVSNIENLYDMLIENAVYQFRAGISINWEMLYNTMNAGIDCLPNYAFNKQKYWLVNQRHLVDEIDGPNAFDEYINSIECVEDRENKWIFEIKNDSALVNGHLIDKTKVLVGTCQVQLVQTFLEYLNRDGTTFAVRDWIFAQKIEIEGNIKVQIQLSNPEDQICKGIISCWNKASCCWEKKTNFTVEYFHEQSDDNISQNDSEDMMEDVSFFETETFYEELSEAGLYLGKEYRIINNILCTEKKIYADIEPTELSPAVLDAASQLLYLFSSNTESLELFIPYYFESFRAYDSLELVDRVEAELIEKSNDEISGNLYYYRNESLIAVYKGYHLKLIQHSVDSLLEKIMGKCIQLPNGQELYTQDIKVIGTSLNDHAVYHRLTIPGAYYLSQIMYMAQLKGENGQYALNDINFYNAIVLDETTQIKEAVLLEEKNEQWEVMISSSINNNKDYLLNARMLLSYNTRYENIINIPQLDVKYKYMNIEDILDVQRKIGLHLGTTFNWLQEAWISDNTAQARLENHNFEDLVKTYGVVPGLIDTSVQVLGLLKNVQIKEEGAYIPINIGKIIAYYELQESMWCVTNIQRESDNIIVGEVIYYNQEKTVKLLEIKEMSLIKADSNKLGNIVRENKILFEEKWNYIHELPVTAAKEPQTIIELRYGTISGKTILNVYKKNLDEYLLAEKLVLDFKDQKNTIQVLKAYLEEQVDKVIILSDSGAFKMNYSLETNTVREMVQNITEYYFQALKILENMNVRECQIYCITNSACKIVDDDVQENVIGSVVWGLVRSLQRELVELDLIIVDLDQGWQKIFSIIAACAKAGNNQIGLRRGQFYFPGVAEVQSYKNKENNIELNLEKTFIIIGGFGALGYKTCEMLVELGVKNLIVIGQSEFGQKQSQYKALLEEKENVNVSYYQVDVSTFDAYEKFRNILLNTNSIGGVIFAAGIVIDKYHANYQKDDIDLVYASKINGTYMLAKVLVEIKVDFCVCYSSIVSVLGSAGQSVYGAANSFQDFICAYMRQNGVNMFTVQWGPWGEVGMFSKVDQKGVERYEKRNIYALSPERALLGLGKVIQMKKNIIVANMIMKNSNKTATKKQSANTVSKLTKVEDTTIDKVKIIVASCMGISEKHAIDDTRSFLEMGIDSLLAVEIRSRINREFKCNLPLELFFDNMNIQSIVQVLDGDEKAFSREKRK